MGKLALWLIANHKKLFKAILSLAVGFLLVFCVSTYKQNKKLSERLEIANNNIEAYLGVIYNSQLANNVLKLTIKDLENNNDKVLHQLDSVRKLLGIKNKLINLAATQTQTLDVSGSKGIGGDIVEILKDSTYKDSISFNDLTTVYYTIGKDTVNIKLDIKNTLYLYTFSKREYKNKKSFLKRLFTLDFKKINKYRYEIVNSNTLLNTSDVRVVEMNE